MPPDAAQPFDIDAVAKSFAALAKSTITINGADLAFIMFLILLAAFVAAYIAVNKD